MKCNGYICDLCNKHIEDDEGMLKIKGKRKWYSWEADSWWEYTHIHICRNCQDKIKYYFRVKKSKED